MKAVIQNVEWSQHRYALYSDAEYNDDRKSFPNKDWKRMPLEMNHSH